MLTNEDQAKRAEVWLKKLNKELRKAQTDEMIHAIYAGIIQNVINDLTKKVAEYKGKTKK